MAPKRNGVVPNAHFKKHWERYVKTWFNQPGQKKRRRTKRLQKAAAVAPRPANGPLRPVVRCQTFKYNTKVRSGRGFTFEELKAAGVSKKQALKIGIAVDHRRRNRSLESLQTNTQRLKEYKSKLILFPRKMSKPRPGDSDADACKMATQLSGTILPIRRQVMRQKARAVTADEKKYSVFETMRVARIDKKLIGIREKRAKQKAEEDKMKKK
uniref:60S ribosomal protein L13 n=1 Tax=Suberites domuncula TaxID=55567 RepID=Q4KTH3_SUBDO|nr:L13 [Suberites domuncula]